uniref:Reverse transcriptase domain-containing protein n=1 Tax=Euglena archaeoplastidiata TaxID=1188008 RepID=A0A1X9GCM5_9EUGL|nr:hypothetical protein [Euglena archaeoplastidiata]AKR17892.1 hypothetical protein [Euglena archaeoplastidiata]
MKKEENELLSNIEFSKKMLTKFHNKDYYESEVFKQRQRNIGFMKQEKVKTQYEKKVSEINRIFLNRVQKDKLEGNVFNIIQKIFIKNQEYAFGKSKKEPKNSDLLSLLANEDLLIASYKKLMKKNEEMNEALPISIDKHEKFIQEGKSSVNKTTESLAGLSKEIFRKISKLIKSNKYPWNASRQIYLSRTDKNNVQIPITIPSFMNKVIQEALTTILMAIYEPYFEAKNCSFGFRPNKGIHDAIIPLTGTNAVGMIHTLEGNIKCTYYRVNKNKLIEILNKKIQDRKFLEFIRKRLDYEFYGSKEEKYLEGILALHQGGVDLPYLWNIYMSVFDDYTVDFLQKEVDKITYDYSNELQLRFIYIRYAGHWIILVNMKTGILKKIRLILSEFLKTELYAELSLEKTLITNIIENSAHFLGFEIQTCKSFETTKCNQKNKGKTRQRKVILSEREVFNRSNKRKMINVLHMKGYCDKKGFPREIGFLTNLEDFLIIERFNFVLAGLGLYYVEFVKNPRKDLGRLIYIIRYSCLKTLAQKHKTTIKKIFKKYHEDSTSFKNRKSKEKTIIVKMQNLTANVTHCKIWKLKTTEEIISNALKLKRKKVLNDIYWKLKKGEPHIYLDSEKFRIRNYSYVERINWINIIKSQSEFELICSICGSRKSIKMHGIKHLQRKNDDLINQDRIWKQKMFIRNRKQIPLCRGCRSNIIANMVT